MEGPRWRPLGELIVERGLISQEDLEDALLEQRITHKRLGTILIDKGIVTAQQLTDSLVDQIGAEELLDELGQSENGEDEQKPERQPRSLGAPLRRFRTRIHIDLPASTRIAKPFTRIGAKANPLGHRRHDAPVAPFAPFRTPPADDEPEEPFENAVLELVDYDRAEPEPEPEFEPEVDPEPEATFEPEPEPPEPELHGWLAAARRALDDAEVEIHRLDNFAIARAVELEEARAELAGHRAEAAKASEAHARAEEEIGSLHALIDERDAGLTAMEGTVEELREILGARQTELEAATAESERRGTRVTELEVRVAELAENLSATDETLGIEMQAREHAQRESKRLHEELDDRDARVAKLARQVEALEKELEVVVAEREQATRKLRSHERRVTKLESTLADLRVEQETASAAPAAEHVEVEEPQPEPQKPVAKADAKEQPKKPEPAVAEQQTEGFLYFMPRAGEGYELVEQPGSAPAVGDTIEHEGKSFEVTRHSRSPLPFDRRVCVYLRVS